MLFPISQRSAIRVQEDWNTKFLGQRLMKNELEWKHLKKLPSL